MMSNGVMNFPVLVKSSTLEKLSKPQADFIKDRLALTQQNRLFSGKNWADLHLSAIETRSLARYIVQ